MVSYLLIAICRIPSVGFGAHFPSRNRKEAKSEARPCHSCWLPYPHTTSAAPLPGGARSPSTPHLSPRPAPFNSCFGPPGFGCEVRSSCVLKAWTVICSSSFQNLIRPHSSFFFPPLATVFDASTPPARCRPLQVVGLSQRPMLSLSLIHTAHLSKDVRQVMTRGGDSTPHTRNLPVRSPARTLSRSNSCLLSPFN